MAYSEGRMHDSSIIPETMGFCFSVTGVTYLLESEFQARLIKKLRKLFPGCVILKNDSSHVQGIPDLSIFYGNRWAMLECKAAYDSPERVNQRYYVETLNEMSYAAFIFPENEEDVLREIQQALSP